MRLGLATLQQMMSLMMRRKGGSLRLMQSLMKSEVMVSTNTTTMRGKT